MLARSSQDIDIHVLSTSPRARLRVRWFETFGKQPPPAFGRELLALGIAYAAQEQQYGGLSKSRAREIDRLLEHAPIKTRGERQAAEVVQITRPGTVLVREWQGTTHQVTVLADGYGWNGRHHASLSGIAQAITGTKWNGPRFFGLREAAHGV